MRRLILLLIMLGVVASLQARDVFVMLSGGVSPFDNNYSQYLQARAVNAYFETNYPRNSVWTFFGAGNVEGEKPVLADVRTKVKRDKWSLDSWVAGAIPHNLPATREVILRTFRDEILPAVAEGGTIFLIVGDHGSRSTRAEESEIDLWELERDHAQRNGWRYETNSTLGVKELRRLFAEGLGKGRVVFCMTQCHSGGFHGLGVPREVSPNEKWFTRPPEWLRPKSEVVFPRAAGFTATDEFSMAAGCMADPDPNHWAGYERFIPENLLGMDLFSRKTLRPGLRSFAEAHVAATLQDFTIDKPSASSEEYLERWATLLEKRLTKESGLTSKARAAVTAYQRVVDGYEPKTKDAAFRERHKQFGQFIASMGNESPNLRTLLMTGTRRQLENAMGTEEEQRMADASSQTNRPPRRRGGGGGGGAETRKLWREGITPAWTEAVAAGHITNRILFPIEFERHLLKLEKEKNQSFANGGRSLLEEGFWFSGYGKPETVNAEQAFLVSRWTMERRSKIIEWAVANDDEEVRSAGMKISLRRPRNRAAAPVMEGPSVDYAETLDEETAAKRALFYRRVLGAWEFLLAMNERPALARVAELTELERTALPLPKVR